MKKHVARAIAELDEAEALLGAEPLYHAIDGRPARRRVAFPPREALGLAGRQKSWPPPSYWSSSKLRRLWLRSRPFLPMSSLSPWSARGPFRSLQRRPQNDLLIRIGRVDNREVHCPADAVGDELPVPNS